MSFSRSKTTIAAVSATIALLFSSSVLAADYTVEINKTSVLRLPVPAAAVVIGNPEIADISVHSSDTLLLNGRGYGETNILVFDEFGQTVMNAEIQVRAPKSDSGIRVNFIGEGQKTYSCTPHCVPAPIKGDASSFVGQFEGQAITTTNTIATGPTTTSSQQNSQSFAQSPSELQR